jgi:ABC-type phosphate transport system ATPase subunit
MISEGRFTQPPDYVVVARIVMTTKGALELAEAIKSTVAKSGHDWTTTQQQRTCVTKTFR